MVSGLGPRAVLASTTPLLRTLAVHGGGPVTALRRHADAVAEAQRLGYAEADPAFDIDGVDAAHKLAVLAALAFGTPVARRFGTRRFFAFMALAAGAARLLSL